MEAESRIKLRKIFLEEAEEEKRQRRVEYGTVVGESLVKNYTQSQEEQQQQQQVQNSQQENKGVEFGTSMGGSFIKQ
jgi:hypothetical protein